MAVKMIKFVIEFPDTKANLEACDDLGDMIYVAEEIALAVADTVGLEKVKVKEFL